MGKNIIILSDGTGQKGGKGENTNVYKLFNIIEDRTDKQIAFYDPGIGTDWHKLTGNAFGRGFSKNILDSYLFLFEHFRADDKIFLFGFSRGAATVRSLSYFLHLFGILPKSRPDLVKKAFKIYRSNKGDKREEKAKAFIDKHHTMWCKIEFLGVWDTVAALGLPVRWLSIILDKIYPHQFHNFRLCENVLNARQALALDERRYTFRPVIWENHKQGLATGIIKQVWFCGVHTDIGGGYLQEDLSDISLQWMMQEAIRKGLRIYIKSAALDRLINSEFDVDGDMHDETKKLPFKWLKQDDRSWDTELYGPPTIHASVRDRRKNSNNEDEGYQSWILDEDKHEAHYLEPWDKNYLRNYKNILLALSYS